MSKGLKNSQYDLTEKNKEREYKKQIQKFRQIQEQTNWTNWEPRLYSNQKNINQNHNVIPLYTNSIRKKLRSLTSPNVEKNGKQQDYVLVV